MPIQFRCPGCSQPIEVDDQYAGQNATCPYCRQVIAVPVASTLDAAPSAAARPAVGGLQPADVIPPVPPPLPYPPAEDGLHVGPTMTYRDQVARTYGNYALICTALAAGLMLATMAYSAAIVSHNMAEYAASQTTLDPEMMRHMQEQMALEHPELSAGLLGAFFFGLVGLVLGIISLKHSRRENWRGYVTTILCGLFILGFCGITALTMLLQTPFGM